MTTPWSEPEALALIEKYGPVQWWGCCANNPSFQLVYRKEGAEPPHAWFKHAHMRAGWLPHDALSDHEAECILNNWAEKVLYDRGLLYRMQITRSGSWRIECLTDDTRISLEAWVETTKAAALIAALKEMK